MLISIIRYLQGYVKIRVTGYSPERFLNLCNARGILVWGIENSGTSSYDMYMSVRKYKKLRPLVRKTGTKAVLMERHGLPFFINRYRKRRLFFAGILFCILCIYILSLFIWNIHFQGNVSYSVSTLQSFLESEGVVHGMPKAKVDCENIEQSLRHEFPGILWVSAQLKGTRLIIEIRENTDKDIVAKIQDKNENSPKTIQSDCAGIVKSLTVRKGTPAVSIGESVQPGEDLVYGYYPIIDDNKVIIRYEPVVADADILIETTKEYRDEFPMTYQEHVYTGKSKWNVEILIKGHKIVLGEKPSYESYDKLNTDTKTLHITENFYLPVSISKIQYKEYENVKKTYTENDAKNEALKHLQAYCEKNLQKGVQIIEKDVKIDTNNVACKAIGNFILLVPVQSYVNAVVPEPETLEEPVN